MHSKSLYVFDTNVIVSALLLSDSIPRLAFDKALACGRIILSEPVINELDDVLRRPQLKKYIRDDERIRFLVEFLRKAYIVKVTEFVADCRDLKDNKYLELAHEGHAKCIATGDKDLLDLNPYRGIAVLTPRQFLDSR